MQLTRTSRRAAAASGLGAAVMFVSLGLSTLALRDQVAQVNASRVQLATLESQRRELKDSLAQLALQRVQAERDLADTKEKLAMAKRQAETAQDDVADLNAALDASTAAPAPAPALVTPSPSISAHERARAEWRAGQAARQRNEIAVAERHFQAAIAADPSYAPAYNSLGRLAAARGDVSAADRLYRQSLVHDPSYRAALYNLATLTEATRGAKAALAPAQALLKLQPSDVRSQNLVARLSATAER